MGSRKANEAGIASSAGLMVPARSEHHTSQETGLAAYLAGEPGLVEVGPCQRGEREPGLTFSPITMRPEIRDAALDLIKMLQLFLRHSPGRLQFRKIALHCIYRYVSFYCVL